MIAAPYANELRRIGEPLGSALPPLPPALRCLGRRPFVGRTASLRALYAAWEGARAGAGSVLLLRGDAGIGKTRLAVELARIVAAHDGICLYGRCDEEPLTPYQPIADSLRGLPTAAPQATGAARAVVDAPGPPLFVPELGAGSPAGANPEVARSRLFAAVKTLLHGAADLAPVLLVVDDAHWADAATLRLLRHIAESSVDARMLVLVTYRDVDVDDRHPLGELLASLRRRCSVRDIALRGMSEQEIAELTLMSLDDPLPPSAVAAVHRVTAGNPFFVEELLRELVDSAEARDPKEALAVTIEAAAVPLGVAALIRQRLSRLGSCCNSLLEVAAVIGLEFDLPVLEAVCGVDADKAVSCLESALRARLVSETPEPVGRFAFYHPLVRGALLEGITQARRALIHRRVAETVVDDAPTGPDATVDGVHALAGELRCDGEFWTVAAGNEAVRLRDSLGVRYVATLLRNPHREMHALDLVGACSPSRCDAPPTTMASARAAQAGLGPESNVAAFADSQAREAYKRRFEELAEELADADAGNDPEHATRCRLERDLLMDELTRGFGLSGRERPGNVAAERARSSVTKAIRHALDRLTAANPRLGYALASGIRTGTFCVFDPGPLPAIRWSV